MRCTSTARRLTVLALSLVCLTTAIGLGSAQGQSTATATATATATSKLPFILQASPSALASERYVRFPTLFTLADNPTWFVAGKTGSLAHPAGLRWTVWTSKQAVAVGAFWVYLPPLADPTAARYSMTMTFSAPRILRGRLVFTHLSIHITGAKVPKGYTRVMNSHVVAYLKSKYYLYSGQ